MKFCNLFSIQLLICIYFLLSNAYTELIGDPKEEVIIQGAKSTSLQPEPPQQIIIDKQSPQSLQSLPPLPATPQQQQQQQQQPFESTTTIPPTTPPPTSFNCSLPKYKIDLALLAATSDNDIKLVKCLLENGYCYYLIILL